MKIKDLLSHKWGFDASSGLVSGVFGEPRCKKCGTDVLSPEAAEICPGAAPLEGKENNDG